MSWGTSSLLLVPDMGLMMNMMRRLFFISFAKLRILPEYLSLITIKIVKIKKYLLFCARIE